MDKSALKKAYKQIKQPMGIYRISSSQIDNIFIGCATNLRARLNRHRADLKFRSHQNKELQNVWDSFGESAIEFEILDVLEHDESSSTKPKEELQVLLEMWFQRLQKEGVSVVCC